MLKAIKYIAIYKSAKLLGKAALTIYAKNVRKNYEANLGTYFLSALTGYHVGLAESFSPFSKDEFLDLVNETIDLTHE